MRMSFLSRRAYAPASASMALVLSLLIAMVAADSPADTGPMAQAKVTVEAVLEALRNKDLPHDIRRKKITDLIKDRFDFRAMSQSVMALNWRRINNDEKDRFVNLFSKMLESAYIGRIEAYTDEVVEFVRERIDGRKALVDTLIKTGTVDIPISYKLIDRGGKWLVYDVVIEEVSLVRNYRGSFREIMSKEGFDGLIARMESKIEESNKADQQGGKE